ncbi:MAG: hypothetical protein NT092_07910 [Bacteroidia bacterium]|nr:hypothetical protein [Bacteroidia bacterium]
MISHERVTLELVEEKGKIFERFGLTPMQGRIVAYFIVSDAPERTFEELVNYFQASKSSVSSSLNFLLQNKIIDYRTISARRKRYFFITDTFFRVYFEKVLENVAELKEYAFEAVSMRTPEYPRVSENILKWIGDANKFQETMEKTLAEIRKDRS